jgi:WD40 repeat protein
MIGLFIALLMTLAAEPAVDRYGDPLPPGAVARIGSPLFRNKSGFRCLTVLPDRRHAAFADGDKVAVIDLDSGKIIRRIARATNSHGELRIKSLTLSPDGRTIAVGCHYAGRVDRTVLKLWLGDLNAGTVIREIPGTEHPIRAVAFVSGGGQVAVLNADFRHFRGPGSPIEPAGHVVVWDARSGAKVRELTADGRPFIELAASPDGSLIAARGEAQGAAAPIFIFESATGKRLHTLADQTSRLAALVFSPDARVLVSGGQGALRFWDVADGRELRKFIWPAIEGRGAGSRVDSLAFSPDGRTIAAHSGDSTVRVFDNPSGRLVDEVPAPSRPDAKSAAFRDNDSLIFSDRMTLGRRDIRARTTLPYEGPDERVASLCFTPDSRKVITAENGWTRTWDAADGRPLSAKSWPLNGGAVASSDGRWAALSGYDADHFTVAIADLSTGQILTRLPGRHEPVAFSRRNASLLMQGLSNSEPPKPEYSVWQIPTGVKVGVIHHDERAPPGEIALAPDGRTVFTVEPSAASPLRRRDVASDRVLREYLLPEGRVPSRVCVSAGGRRLAAFSHFITAVGPDEMIIRVWDVSTGRECWQSNAPLGNSTAFSPDGAWLVTTAASGVGIWDARTGTHVVDFPGDGKPISGVAFSPDGRRFTTALADGTVLVWDLEAVTGRRVVDILDPSRQAEMWADLAGSDALGAHAVDCLQAAPAAAVAILKSRLRPAVAVPADRVGPLIAGLDAGAYAAREKAQRELTALGPDATAAVRTARDAANAEVRRRLDAVLSQWEAGERQSSRAVEVLGYVNTPDAGKLLADLAGGDPAARLTREAKAALASTAAPP